jgi:hypothetical protein
MNKFEEYSQPTFEIYEEPIEGVQAVLHNIYIHNNTYHMDNYTYGIKHLIGLENIFNVIDKKQFMTDTTLQPVIDFNDKLEGLHARFIWPEMMASISNIDVDYKPDVTDKFNWKRGIYDYIRGVTDFYEKRQMRNSGIDTFFNRVESSRWAYNNFKEKMKELDIARLKARRVSYRDVDVETLELTYDTVIEQIISQTKLANKMSDNFKIYNYMSRCMNDFANMDVSKHLTTKLTTVVVCESKTMDIVVTSGTKVGEMLLPKTYLTFDRLLYKTLLNSNNGHITDNASSPGGRHPYIASHGAGFYDRDSTRSSNNSFNLTGAAWYSLCLSSFHDDVHKSLINNDYISMLMGLSGWNSIYNIESTQPHNNPKQIFYQTGFHFGNNSKKEIESLRRWVAFNEISCFRQQIDDFLQVETNSNYREFNNSMDRKMGIVNYGVDIISTCEAKQCPYMDNCIGYLRVKKYLTNEDFICMIESIVGFIRSEDYQDKRPYIGEDNSRHFALMMYRILNGYMFNSETNELDDTALIDDMYYYLSDNCYWDNVVEEEKPKEAELSMPDKLVAWSVSQNNERGSADGR